MFLKRMLIAVLTLSILLTIACEQAPGNDPVVDNPDPLPSDAAELIDMLLEPQQTRINEITDALVAKGPSMISMIFTAIEDNQTAKEVAGLAIAKFGVDAVDPCIEALGSQYLHVRYAATIAIGEIGPDAESAWEPMVNLFSQTLKSEQKIIMVNLQKITSNSEVVSLVKAAMRIGDLRFDAMRTLAKWGPDASIAIGSLGGYLVDENDQTRWEAMDALGMIGVDDAAIDGIVDNLLNHPEERIRKKAAETLGVIGSPAAAGTNALVSGLIDEDVDVQEQCAKALGLIAPDSRAGIPGLIEALSAESPTTRREAIIALGAFGSEASSALDALRAIESNSDELDYLIREAGFAIAAIEGE